MAKTLNLKLDLRIASAALLVLVLLMLGLWRPWQSDGVVRKITVAGQAKLTAEPDHYVFNPSYQRSNGNREAAINALNNQVTAITDNLKELGVPDSGIELQSSAYETYYREPDSNAVTAYLTIKVDNKELAEKVQNYLVTTNPTGQITPQPSFSDERRKQLETEARDKAVANAREQAERTAKQLDAKLGHILEIKDVTSGGIILPFEGRTSSPSIAEDTSSSSLPIFPGEQEVSFTVEAVFEIK